MLVLYTVAHKIKRTKSNLIVHILHMNCLLRFTEGKTEVTGRRGRKREQLVDDLKETSRGWDLKEEALDRTVSRTRFG